MVQQSDPALIKKEVERHKTPFQLTDPQHQIHVEEVLSVFRLSDAKILKLAEVFTEQLENGLRYDGSSPFTMQNTFVHHLLDGTEEGKFLSLDLGGSNFRILLIELRNGEMSRQEIGRYEVSEKLRTGPGTELFDFIASCILDFATKQGVVEEKLPLGFTFSFPMSQTALDTGILTTWVGQYDASGVVGQDVVEMLKEAISRTKVLNVDIVAILNDTTGTLLRGSLIDPDTALSFILGTGSNVAYIEKTSRMTGWTEKEDGERGMEVLNGPWRTVMATLTHIPFNLGTIMMAGVAYLTRDWRTFQLVISLPIALIFIYPWLIPESPRWLMAVGRDREALKILQEAAQSNNRPLPEKIPELKKKVEEGTGERKAGVMDLLRTPNMRKKTLVAWFCWINVGLCFFGLEQYLSQVGGNIFVNVALSSACIIPGVLSSILTMDKLGRRWTLCAGQLVAALSCFIIIMIPKEAEWWRVSFATIGVTGTAIAFTTLYLYSTELFPTVVRNTGLGIGSMVAPFVASLDKVLWHNAPALMFGVSCSLATGLCLLRPETLGTLLPVTLADGEAFQGMKMEDADKKKKGAENKGYAEDIAIET